MPAQSRQLAAIMFTDIVGYTALMGEDEQKAFELLKKNRAVQRPIIEKYHGRWLKEIGDGVLASFTTVSDAVYCAATIQKTCQDHPDLNLRIGIHQGEVVFEGSDVFGDGVNIASRLEPLAPIGGILVSESVHRNLGNKTNLVSTFVKEEQLKNVKEPLKTYEVRAEGIESFKPMITKVQTPLPRAEESIWFNTKKLRFISLAIIIVFAIAYFLYSQEGEKETEQVIPESIDKSIVVIPFDNESSDEENEYFINGMTEDIRNNLSKISDLRVISKTSSEKYRGTSLLSSQIGEELAVTYILEGTAQKIGSQVKIHAQLIITETEDHIWSESYVRDFDDVFKVQSEIAQEVANQLKITLASDEIQKIEQAPTKNTAAYEFYLKGNQSRGEWHRTKEKETIEEAISLYIKAEKEDPLFVWPMVARAGIYNLAYLSIELAQQVSLDSVLILCNRALAIDPNYASAYRTRSVYYTEIGEDNKSFLDRKKAWDLDPNNIDNLHSLGNSHFNAQNYIEGLQLIHQYLRLSSSEGLIFWTLHRLGFMYLEVGDVELALYYWDQMGLLEKDAAVDISTRIQLYRGLKQWNTCYDLIQKYKSLYPEKKRSELDALGMYYTERREFEKALDSFQKAEKERPSAHEDWPEMNLKVKLYYGIALFLSGAEAEGVRMLNDCLIGYAELSPFNNVFDKEVQIAAIHTFLGNKGEAYNWLRKSNWTGWSLIVQEQGVLFSKINREKEFQDIISSVKAERKEVREEIARLKAAGEWEI